jgi:pimeloyl-ACP methyl ester carboxylesterase
MLDHQAKFTLHEDIADSIQVVALHCSGSTGHQWSHLKTLLSGQVQLQSPDLLGTASRGHWPGGKTFSLRDEAVAVVNNIQAMGSPVHIVGHSYGGALALHIAANHPHLVRSLCLYEPTCFWTLRGSDASDTMLLAEIENLSANIMFATADGRTHHAAKLFTEFWGGTGSWQALTRTRRNQLAAWVPKAWLDFRALIDESSTSTAALNDIPMTLIVGEDTHQQTKRIVSKIVADIPKAKVVRMKDADHLGPFCFRDAFAGIVWRHLKEVLEIDDAPPEVSESNQ